MDGMGVVNAARLNYKMDLGNDNHKRQENN